MQGFAEILSVRPPYSDLPETIRHTDGFRGYQIGSAQIG